ncbi:hypothetical protein APHAL10511_005892 [Amanita phalloides]|nr:hypothetical protein APHAL10511_005892 [Amanita phalloides]
MFTGLIEHMGSVAATNRDDKGCTLTIGDAAPVLDDCHIGDSIAVNGACLTVTEFDREGWFKVWLANETLQRTNLGELTVGSPVNLERAMGAHARFGGHFVQAHVDSTATITQCVADGDSVRLTFELPDAILLPYLIPKGYVAVDGASLTVTGVEDERREFGVMLIKHTQERITVGRKGVGDRVNIEVDMIGKYVYKSVGAVLAGDGSGALRRVVEDVLRRIRPRPASPARPPPSRLRSPPVKITSKISGVVKSNHGPIESPRPSASSSISPPTSPPIPNARPVFYPITIATSAANPFRYSPSRPPAKRLGSPFGFSLKVDPNTPPLSPPISTISISSRSSTSHKTGSLTTKDGSTSPEYSPSEDDNSDEHKVKAAAKSNRKIADLEITNRSLMAINASLETAKNKQAQEIRELRRKLRESRLILPPRAYRAVKSSLDHDDTGDEEDGNDDDDDTDDAEETDQVFIRLKSMLEALLESGRRALETKVADLGGAGSPAKVLSADQTTLIEL